MFFFRSSEFLDKFYEEQSLITPLTNKCHLLYLLNILYINI
jgi:hypothetical protein